MGSIPVANPAPGWGSRARRPPFPVFPVLSLLAACVAAAVVLTIFLWPSQTGPVFAAGRVGDLQELEPEYFEEGGFYVVLQPDGEVIALADADAGSMLRTWGCEAIPWRPDFVFMDRAGWFRSACTGCTFDRVGTIYAGPCARGMDLYAVEIRGGDIYVDTDDVACQPATPAEFCPYRGGDGG